ncbi:Hypothetical predicted protein, partial [Prunus dulcis]
PVNGFVCKDSKLVDANDFFFSGLHLAGNTSNAVGPPLTQSKFQDLILLASPLCVSIMPRAVLRKGDVFVFPVGLVHFQQNVGYGNAVAIAALNSQNPGVITVANAVFGSKPDISADVLAKAFQVDKNRVYNFQSKF